MSFLITSHGRTATKWFAWLLNKSSWTVLHEPRKHTDNIPFDSWGMYNIKVPEHIQEAFNADIYGEVNSVMKYYFFDLVCDKKAVIYRNWEDVVLSFLNRRSDLFYKIAEINYFHKLFYEFWKDGKCNMIWYELLTSDIDYCQVIVDWLDIDLKVKEKDLSTIINKNATIKYKSFTDIPDHIREYIYHFDWVNYYG